MISSETIFLSSAEDGLVSSDNILDLNACGMHFHFQCETDLGKHCAYVVFHGLGTNVEHVKIMILFS